MPSLSRRVQALKPSATLALGARAKALKQAGRDVLNFTLGEPDFDTPAPIRRAAAEALEAGQTHYMPTLGDAETRGAVAEKLRRENGIAGLSWEHVAISVGAKHSFYLVCQCLLDEGTEARRHEGTEGEAEEGVEAGRHPGTDVARRRDAGAIDAASGVRPAPWRPGDDAIEGGREPFPLRPRSGGGGGGRGPADEVLLPAPAWVSYAPIAELAGGRIVELPTSPETDFTVTPEQLRRAITPRSRMLVLNSPSNPCGTMYTPDRLRELAAVVAGAAATVAPELVIVTDEIYEKITYGAIPHFSIGSIPEVAERTITINGMSKAYAMTGWRIGYAACPGDFGRSLIKSIDTLQGQMTSCITSFLYPAIREALAHGEGAAAAMRDEFATRAALIYDLAAAIPGLRCTRPTGAFYVFPDVSACYGKRTAGGRPVRDSVSFSEALLEEELVAVIPGGEFGGPGDRHVRISFACSPETIRRGMERLGRFMGGMR